MPQAGQGNKVQVHYTGKLNDGTVFDSSIGHEPLEFTIGQQQMIPGFEEGVLGMQVGESKTITISSEQAYGPHHADRVIQVSRTELPPQLEIGMQLQGSQPGGNVVSFTVVAVTKSMVTMDGNHPLAGKDLIFDIQLGQVS